MWKMSGGGKAGDWEADTITYTKDDGDVDYGHGDGPGVSRWLRGLVSGLHWTW